MDLNKSYQRRAKQAALFARKRVYHARNIRKIPPIRNPQRREACKNDLKQFCIEYFPQVFYLPFSDDHITAIRRIQNLILSKTGCYAFAMPRGNGKTSLTLAATMWAVLYAHSKYAAIIAATAEAAKNLLIIIRSELESNDLLLADFPEVCYFIRLLDGLWARTPAQTYRGQRTKISYRTTELILPTIPNSQSSGAIIKALGLTGRLRGLVHRSSDGAILRPSLVILDDPQTDISAHSHSQCAARERLINQCILNLAGADSNLAIIMPCTVIRQGDLADTFLDRSRYPRFQGDRFKLVYEFPKNEQLWNQYAKIRMESLQKGDDGTEANEFYLAHREEMDEGARIAWSERYTSNEVSALQFAMNKKYDEPQAFFAEYQNEPSPQEQGSTVRLTLDDLATINNNFPRLQVPRETIVLTSFIDPHEALLYYMTVAWTDKFTGFIVDYGTYPHQNLPYFRMCNAAPTLADIYRGKTTLDAVLQGVSDLIDTLVDKGYNKEESGTIQIDKILVDAGYGLLTEPLYLLIRTHKHRSLVLPSLGQYVGATSAPFGVGRVNVGDRLGFHWKLCSTKTGIRVLRFDTNWWKSFCAQKLKQPIATGISVYGENPGVHRLLFDHFLAEVPIVVEAVGRSVVEWKDKASKPDQHWWDCLVGCAVAASFLGIGASYERTTKQQIKRITLQEMAAKARRLQVQHPGEKL